MPNGTDHRSVHESPALQDFEDLPSATAIEAEHLLYCAGEPHPMDLERGEAHCSCDRCSRWDRFVRGEEPGGWPRYEVLTSELVAGLAAWLRGVAASSSRSLASPLRVLEVGAGDGRLTQWLKRALAHCPVLLVATDSFACGLRAVAPVEALDYHAALARESPHVVLCCWMPLGQDWSLAMRAAHSVTHYVLVGEVDDGCCGQPWGTWGYIAGDDGSCSVSSTSSDSSDGGGEAEGEAWRRVYVNRPQSTPWGAEGWSRCELDQLSALQICRTDTPWCATRHSRTTVFTRGSPLE